MATQERWFFSKEKLANTPSKKDGIDMRKELFYRQQAATLVQDMGQKLVVYPLAVALLPRFFMFSFLYLIFYLKMVSSSICNVIFHCA